MEKMNFDLKKPCAKCPFRTDCLKGWLGEERAEEIATGITEEQQTFSCHETAPVFDSTQEFIKHHAERNAHGYLA